MADNVPASQPSRPEPLGVLWRALAAPQGPMVCLCLLSLLLAAAGLIPQIPTSARADPQGWLAIQPGPLGQSELLQALRLYDIADSFAFRLLVGLLTLSLLVWTVEAAERAWRAAGPMHRPMDGGPSAIGHWSSAVVDCPQSPVEALSRVRQSLTAGHDHWADVQDGPVPAGVAWRRPLALWTAPLAGIGLLAGLVGLFVMSSWGWQTSDWEPELGQSQALGNGSLYHVRLDALNLQWDRAGRLGGSESQLTWLAGETAVAQGTARPGRPTRLRGVAVRQVGILPALKVRAFDGAGHPLALQEDREPGAAPAGAQVVFPDAQARLLLPLPERDALLAFTFEPLDSAGRPALHTALLQGSETETQDLGTLHQSGILAGEDLRLEVDVAYRPVLRADYRPGLGVAVIGAALALVTLAVGWLWPARLMWLAAVPAPNEGSAVHLAVLPTPGHRRWLAGLMQAVGQGEDGEKQARGVRFASYLEGASRLAFIVLGIGLTLGAAYGWWVTGRLAIDNLGESWLAASWLLVASSLLAWHLRRQTVRWAVILALAAICSGLIGLVHSVCCVA